MAWRISEAGYTQKLNEGDYRLDQVYIKKKRFSSSHNTVPYWPWNKDTYNHSRLFVICQVIENVNKLFDGMLTVDFPTIRFWITLRVTRRRMLKSC